MLLIESIGFLSFGAQNFVEYIDGFYGFITILVFSLNFAIHIWMIENIFLFIENFGNVVQRSKHKF